MRTGERHFVLVRKQNTLRGALNIQIGNMLFSFPPALTLSLRTWCFERHGGQWRHDCNGVHHQRQQWSKQQQRKNNGLDETTGEHKLQIDKLQLIARTSTSFVIAHRRATLRPGTQTEPIKG